MEPPQITMPAPTHVALWSRLAEGAPVVDVLLQMRLAGSSRLPVWVTVEVVSSPPQTVICFPSHTAECFCLAAGAPVLTSVHPPLR